MSTAERQPSAADWYDARIRDGDWQAVVERDEQRFTAMAHAARFRFYALTDQDCEDITQNTIIQILRNSALYEPSRGSYLAWSQKICQNEIKKRLRAFQGVCSDAMDRPNAARLDEEVLPVTGSCRLNDIENTTVSGLALKRALESLGPKDRWILEMYYWQGMLPEEIAGLLNIQTEAARRRIQRARARVADLLGGTRGLGTDEREEQ
jgi:RNA polymerase sigma factor (sigma-70 family)